MQTKQPPKYLMGSSEWLEERRKTVGCSDIAAILGLSPWRSAFQIYQEKRGEAPATIESAVMRWGKQMELSLRQAYSDITGRTVRVTETILVNKKFPFIGASLDGIAEDRVLEIKTSRSSHGWGEPGTGEIPDYYQTQVQGYLIVTEFPLADVIVSISGSPPVIYTVHEDKEAQQIIIDTCREFWQRVVDGNPPEPVTYSDVVVRFGKVSTAGDVPATDIDCQRVMALRTIQEKIAELEAQKEDLKGKLIISMGEKGDALVTPEGVPLVTYKIAKGRVTFDTKTLQKEQPEVYAKYQRTGEPSRRFLLK